ncbi:MAG TPA: hypothetical protein VH062_23060 [Polyangiaceae bacterium]|nr:hypothetical protein [Polyangiaceae bacterium]
MGSLTTGISLGAKTGDVLSVAGTTIEIANITGTVTSESTVLQIPGSKVTGGVVQHASLGRTTGPTLHVVFPTTSSGSLNVLPAATQTLSPGRYTALNVSALGTLKLRSGVYYFDAYIVDPLATVVVDESAGPVQIFVKTTLQHMGNYKTASGAPPNVLVGFFGIIPTYIGASFPGTVIAPNAQLIIGTNLGGSTLVGAFFAQGIDVLPATTIKHRATDYFGVGGNAVVMRTQEDPQVKGTVVDPANSQPGFKATFTTSNGTTYVTSVTSVPSDPAHPGVAPTRYCDANGNPIAAPSDAALNAQPPAGSTCSAMPTNTTDCPIDPTTLSTLCTTDSDCTGGAICAAKCIDQACNTIEHRCGKAPPSCGGLPAQDACQEWYVCPEDGAVGTTDLAQLHSDIQTTNPLLSDTGVKVADHPALQPFASIQQGLTQGTCGAALPDDVAHQTDVSMKPTGDKTNTKKKQWGLYLTPTSTFDIAPHLKAESLGSILNLSAGGGVEAGAIVLGTPLEVFSAKAEGKITDCGIDIVATVKLLGEAVYAWTNAAATENHMAIGKQGDDIATPELNNTTCLNARKAAQDAISQVRSTNLFARQAWQYYKTNGLTPELCREIEADVDPSQLEDNSPHGPNSPNGLDLACDDIKTDPSLVLGGDDGYNLLNAWKSEYDFTSKHFLSLSNDLGVARQAVSTSGTIDLKLVKPHPYHVKFLDKSYPIWWFILNIVAEGYGFWDVQTGIQYGLGVSGNFDGLDDILQHPGTNPQVGDVRAVIGPVVTPEAGAGVIAYVGIGVPGASVGIEGKLDVITIAVPTTIGVALMRVDETEKRDVEASPYHGTKKTGLDFLNGDFQWVSGIRWGAKLDLDTLDGEISLAARLHFLRWHKTFKHQLANWHPVPTQHITLITGGVGDAALKYGDDYGEEGSDVAYTEVPPLSNPPGGVISMPQTPQDIVLNPTGPQPYTCNPVVQ